MAKIIFSQTSEKFGQIIVRAAGNSTLTTSVIDGGTSNEINRINLSGRALQNTPTIIAVIEIQAGDNVDGKYKFINSPTLTPDELFSIPGESVRDRLKLDFIGINRNSEKGNVIVAYKYNLIYNNTNNVTAADGFRFNLDHKVTNNIHSELEDNFTWNEQPGIDRISYGSKFISRTGESRKITIYGGKGTLFSLQINEVEQNVDSLKNVIGEVETSILKQPNADSKTIPQGYKTRAIEDVIGDDGTYSINQYFPSNLIKTKINGAKTTDTKITFDSLKGVREGDRIMATGIPSSLIVKVLTLNPDGDNINECTLDKSITVADDVGVTFERNNIYRIHLQNKFAGPETNYVHITHDLDQRKDPILTFVMRKTTQGVFSFRCHSFEDDGVTKTNYDGDGVLDEEINTSHPYTAYQFSGVINSIAALLPNPHIHQFNFKFYFEISSGTGNIAVNTAHINNGNPPVFDVNNEELSDWTNTVASKNGGTRFFLSQLSLAVAGGNQSVLIQGKGFIEYWGEEDVTTTLSLDDLITVS